MAEPTNQEILACPNKDTQKGLLIAKYPEATDHVREIIRLIGDDPDREGLKDTPYRVVKSWLELFGGYDDKTDLGTFFEEDLEGDTDEIILCKNIKFYSTCEHHMVPFHGMCHIGYLPSKKIIGLSKMARITERFSRRLQIQEKLTNEIANKLEELLEPQGVGVIIQAQHLCMCARGVKNQSSSMSTSAMRGKFKDQIETRQEFLSLIHMNS